MLSHQCGKPADEVGEFLEAASRDKGRRSEVPPCKAAGRYAVPPRGITPLTLGGLHGHTQWMDRHALLMANLPGLPHDAPLTVRLHRNGCCHSCGGWKFEIKASAGSSCLTASWVLVTSGGPRHSLACSRKPPVSVVTWASSLCACLRLRV